MLEIQYDLFDEKSEISIIRKDIEALKRKFENVQRGLLLLQRLFFKEWYELWERS